MAKEATIFLARNSGAFQASAGRSPLPIPQEAPFNRAPPPCYFWVFFAQMPPIYADINPLLARACSLRKIARKWTNGKTANVHCVVDTRWVGDRQVIGSNPTAVIFFCRACVLGLFRRKGGGLTPTDNSETGGGKSKSAKGRTTRPSRGSRLALLSPTPAAGAPYLWSLSLVHLVSFVLYNPVLQK